MNEAQRKSRIAKSEGYVSVVVNASLGAFKIFVGNVTGSLAVLADGLETLSDCISSIVLLVGIKISEMPADKEHPFGHGRAELVASIVIATLIAVFGVLFAQKGIVKILNRETLEFGILTFSAGIVSVVVKESLAQYAFWCQRKTGFLALKADAQSHRSDAISSALILAGMLLGHFGGENFWWMDGALSVVISIFLLRLAWAILSSASRKLLGSAVPAELETRVKEICTEISGTDLNAHHFHIHEYGTYSELTFHSWFDGETKVSEAHEIADKIENEIREKLKIEATIHIERRKFPSEKSAFPRQKIAEKKSPRERQK